MDLCVAISAQVFLAVSMCCHVRHSVVCAHPPALLRLVLPMKAKRTMKSMKKKRPSGAAVRKRKINQHQAAAVASAMAGNKAEASTHLYLAQKRRAEQAKNYKKKRANWYKAGNVDKPKPQPQSPLPRIDPADDAAAAKARSAAWRLFENIMADI